MICSSLGNFTPIFLYWHNKIVDNWKAWMLFIISMMESTCEGTAAIYFNVFYCSCIAFCVIQTMSQQSMTKWININWQVWTKCSLLDLLDTLVHDKPFIIVFIPHQKWPSVFSAKHWQYKPQPYVLLHLEDTLSNTSTLCHPSPWRNLSKPYCFVHCITLERHCLKHCLSDVN